MTWAFATDAYNSGYNGFRPNKDVANQYRWLGPAKGERTYEPKPDQWKHFPTLKELTIATGHEAPGMEVDFDIFEKLTPPGLSRHSVYHAMDLNFKLKPNGKAVDAGVIIPTVNDNFAGKAPGLGALESGKPETKWGPRWLTWQPFYR